jgi:perosamine synthetase
MSWRVPLFRIAWDEEDVRAVAGVIRSGMSWASGTQVAEFEEGLSSYFGTRHAVTFNSGTSALHAALLSHGTGPGDEVIVPSFTFVATANAPLFVGARPVFADIERKTLGLDPEDVKEKITGKTRCIMPVHYGGCPCLIRELREIAEDHRLILIEDAAEAFGASVEGRKAGTYGDSAVLSFCQNKIITTGEGGAVITDSPEVARRLNLIRSHGRQENGDYFSSCESFEYVSLGYNFRMSSITAALGSSQLSRAGSLIADRIRAAERYRGVLRKTGCEIPAPPLGHLHVYQIFSIRTGNRDGLMSHLKERGIMTKVYFPPAHLTRYHRSLAKTTPHLPVTLEVSGDILTLPFYPGITNGEMDLVAAATKEFCDGVP